MTQLSGNSKLVWRAQEYHDLSFAQAKASEQLLEKLAIGVQDDIIDVGCGTGRFSGKVSNIASQGSVLGIDLSPEMISFARQNYPSSRFPNLFFRVEDAQDMSYHDCFDLVHSSFALQWMKDKNRFLRSSHSCLRKDGRLALIVPLGISPEFEASVDMVVNQSEWKSFFQEFDPGWHFCEAGMIKHLVRENSFRVVYSQSLVEETVFPSQQALEKYVLLWFRHMDALPQGLREEFFGRVMERYYEAVTPAADGSVALCIPQLNLIGNRVTF